MLKRILLPALLVMYFLQAGGVFAQSATLQQQRQQAHKVFRAGDYKDALQLYTKLILNPANQGDASIQNDLRQAKYCLDRLGRQHQQDALFASVVKQQARNWYALKGVADSYLALTNYGYIVSGKFQRGQHRGGGEYVNSTHRDHAYALQLYQRALDTAKTSGATPEQLAGIYIDYAAALIRQKQHTPWRLTLLTDLQVLPDYQEYNVYASEQAYTGSPVTEKGEAVFFALPESFGAAKNDGERWYWLLNEAAHINPHLRARVMYLRAGFLRQLYGVQKLQGALQTSVQQEDSVYGVAQLAENETITRLASGVKRFTLPDQHNYIQIYRQLADDSQSGYQHNAWRELARIFQDRQQYPKAVGFWQKIIEKSPKDTYSQQQLQNITGNWGVFEISGTQLANAPAELLFRFRNARQAQITLHEIRLQRLLDDAKRYIRSNPNNFDYQKINFSNIGYRLVSANEKKYIGKRINRWTQKLQPLPDHFDKRTTIDIPAQKAGAYLVTLQLANGNTSRILLWLNDTVLVRKHLHGQTFYYAADATSGAPVADMQLDLFAYRRDYLRRNKITRQHIYKTTLHDEKAVTNQDGWVSIDYHDKHNSYQWLVIASNKQGRFAFLGFDAIWRNHYDRSRYHERKLLAITDRPVYRPGQTVQYKLWLRHPRYTHKADSEYAAKQVNLRIYNPRGDKLVNQTVTLNEFGGYAAELALEENAALGVYRFELGGYGSLAANSFRVEEYKKPEYAVTVAAVSNTAALGDKVPVRITARYYYGQPVSKGTISYKIYRHEHDARWYPATRWDWLYGNGYWWFAYDTPWFTDWAYWGCRAPSPLWQQNRHTPAPELVAEHSQAIPDNGELTVYIDTSLAKQIYGDRDHRYEVRAEVVDESRRSINGTANILVSHQPFKVYAWLDKGYFKNGERVQASFKAATISQQPVQGEGTIRLFKVTYDKRGKPTEILQDSWPAQINKHGEAQQTFVVNDSGQYRVVLQVSDDKNQTVNGGYVFNVIGDQQRGTALRFNPLELIPQQREFQAGGNAQLLINTQQTQSTVLLFERPVNGIYQTPKVLRLNAKSVQHQLSLTTEDMPNIYVEALTVHNGQVYTEIKELAIPPTNRSMNVKVSTDKPRYLPGEQATLKVQVTDLQNNPVIGDTVISLYDASLEYISGGSNVPDLRKHFWQWRRHHYLNQLTNTQYQSYNLLRQQERTLQPIGALGNVLDMGSTDKDQPGSGKYENKSGRLRAVAKRKAPASAVSGLALSDSSVSEAAEVDLTEAFKPDQSAAADTAANVSIRKQFVDTAFWSANVKLNQRGEAQIKLTMPENLTQWKAKAWSLYHGTQVGQAETQVTTYKNIILRMQAPRFFVEKDEVVLSANIHNYTDKPQSIDARLELDGGQLVLINKRDKSTKLRIKAGAEQRVDWRVRVAREGEAVIRMLARGRDESDAVEMRFPVYVHGIMKTGSFTGSIKSTQTKTRFQIDIPQQRRIDTTTLEIRYSPTLAGAMVDALPYLVDYPYGCTEQTLSRFLPTVITQNVLKNMQLDLNAIQHKRTNLNAQELGDDKQRAAQWRHYQRNPVFDIEQVQEMSAVGVTRLAAMQLSDGGWGWFSGHGEHSSPHTTAYVMHGLLLAKQNGMQVPGDVLQRGTQWLSAHLKQRVAYIRDGEKRRPAQKRLAGNEDAFVYMVLIEAAQDNIAMRDYLYRDKNHLSVYAKAMLALAMQQQQQSKKVTALLQNIEQYLIEDAENQTAYLHLPNQSYWWYWYGSETEAHAYYLKLLARTQPNSRKAAWLVKYLINNRKHATYWQSTRDTAVVIEALAEYIVASGEAQPDMEILIRYDGQIKKRIRINKDNLFQFDNRLLLNATQLQSGKHTISIERKGKGALYYNAYLSYFSLEDYIKRAGLEIKVLRQYYKLVRDDKTVHAADPRGQGVAYKSERYKRLPIKNLDELQSGDLVEVELSIASKNDYEYLIFEDMKPAGFEPLDVRSGYNGNAMNAYVEYRDERVSFFVTRLTRGEHSVSYRMRAETPGKFSALPARGYAMYAPELKANADEIKLRVRD